MNMHQKELREVGDKIVHLFICHEAKRDVQVEPDYNPDRCPFCKADINKEL